MDEKNLYIYNYEPETEFVLTFNVQDKPFEFIVKIIQVIDTKILLSPIRIQGKILNLNAATKKTLIFSQNNSKPIEWSNLAIGIFRDKNNKSFYILDGSIKGNYVNRRNAFRIPIGMQANAQIGKHTSTKEVIIKDISATGFAIIDDKIESEEDIFNSIGKQTRITFTDNNFNYHISLQGTVKRISQLNDNKYLYGCELSKEYKNLENYISLKQRENLIKNSGYKGNINYKSHKTTRKIII